MTFLPVVERELRVAARRRHTYWTRFFTALTAVALGSWIWGWLTEGQPAHERGQIVFRAIASLAFIYSLIAGIGITADCLSEEKREGTLGLLFLTDLKGYDVVLGKLTATSINAVYRLLSVLPILAVPLLMGALTLSEFWRMVLVLVNTLFFSLGAGVVVSSVSVRQHRAMAGTILLILAVAAGPALVGVALAIHDRTVPFNANWLLSSAVYPSVLALDAAYQAHPTQFWSATAMTHGLGWLFLVLASVLVQRTWQDHPAAGRIARWGDRWRDLQYGVGQARAAYRRRLLDLNPICWRVGRDRLKAAYVFALLLALGMIGLGLVWKYSWSLLEQGFYVLVIYLVHTLVKLWLSAEACRPLAEDRRSGALELLLSTPLSIEEVLAGHFLALRRQFAAPAAVILLADFAMLVHGAREQGVDLSWMLLCLVLIVLFIVDLYTSAWVGLWLSLTVPKVNRAISGTIARVLVLPWALFIFGIAVLATGQWQFVEPGELGLLSAGFVLAMINDALLVTWARNNLQQRFRSAAALQFQGRGLRQVLPLDAPPPDPVAPAVLAN